MVPDQPETSVFCFHVCGDVYNADHIVTRRRVRTAYQVRRNDVDTILTILRVRTIELKSFGRIVEEHIIALALALRNECSAVCVCACACMRQCMMRALGLRETENLFPEDCRKCAYARRHRTAPSHVVFSISTQENTCRGTHSHTCRATHSHTHTLAQTLAKRVQHSYVIIISPLQSTSNIYTHTRARVHKPHNIHYSMCSWLARTRSQVKRAWLHILRPGPLVCLCMCARERGFGGCVVVSRAQLSLTQPVTVCFVLLCYHLRENEINCWGLNADGSSARGETSDCVRRPLNHSSSPKRINERTYADAHANSICIGFGVGGRLELIRLRDFFVGSHYARFQRSRRFR